MMDYYEDFNCEFCGAKVGANKWLNGCIYNRCVSTACSKEPSQRYLIQMMQKAKGKKNE